MAWYKLNSYKKGIEPLYWTLIIVVMSVLFLTFSSPLLNKSLEEASRNNEEIIMQNIISGINIVQLSPDSTIYRVLIPGSRQKCQFEARNGIAKLTLVDGGKKSIIFSSYISTIVPVITPNPVDCLNGQITITKSSGAVKIT